MHRLHLRLLSVGLVLGFAAPILPALAQISYEYDAIGRLVSVTYPSGKHVVYDYDDAGNRTSKVIAAAMGNAPPVATDDTYSMNEAATGEWDPRGNDTDPDSNPLTIATVTPPSKGTAEIILSGTQLRYVPTVPFVGTDNFTYTVSDGQGGFDTALVTVTVDNVAPTAQSDSISLAENSSLTLDPRSNDTDPSNLALTIVAKTDGSHGNAIIVNGTDITYTPNANYFGTDSFTYTIEDAHGAQAVGTVNVTVTSTNQPPVAADRSYEVILGQSVTFTPTQSTNDPDGDSLIVSSVTQGSKGTVQIVNSGADVKYTSNNIDAGTDSFTYTVADPENAQATGNVTITIPAGNQPPVANPIPAIYQDVQPGAYIYVNVTSLGTDPDGDALTITAASGAAATILNNGTQIRAIAPFTYNSMDTVNYTISDGNGGEASNSFQIKTEEGGVGGSQ